MIRSFVCIALMLLCVSACSGARDNEKYTGTLYFVTGQVLYAMNLQTRRAIPVYKNLSMVMNSLEKLDDQRLLLGYELLGQGSIRFGELIVNRLNGSVSAYGDGMQIESLQYLPQLKVLVFAGAAGPVDHLSLYWANADAPFQPHLIEGTATVGTIIVISDHQVIYTLGSVGGDFRLMEYDFKTHQSSLLKLTDCNPILWRSRTSQLVCQGGTGAGSYYMTRLDGSGRQAISFGFINNGPYMIAYVRKYDVAVMTVYGEIRFSFTRGFYENSNLYLYSFQTRKLINISDQYAANASLGAAVWYPDTNEFQKGERLTQTVGIGLNRP